MNRFFTIFLTLLITTWVLNVSAESLRVESDWLKQNLNKDKLLILDARSQDDYDVAHIPGAINLPEKLTYQNKDTGGQIAKPDVIQKLFRDRGIDTDKLVVVYDDGALLNAARVFWTLEVYGVKQVRILNGGFADWNTRNYEVSSDTPVIQPSNYVASVDHRRIASKFSTRLASINPKQSVIDARPNEAYRGEKSTAKRFGHIPSAVNIAVHQHFEKQANNSNHLLSINTLAELYKDVPKDEKVILYCEVGTVSTTNYLVLRELGYDVANYDASWREWGNDFNLPIEK